MVGVVGSSPIAPTIPMRARFFPLLLVFLSTAAAAQYPSRPIHLIVPIPPGGAPDIAARVLGQKLAEQMGEPVVVENRAGSNGNLATELVARAAPDGYTLGLVADRQRSAQYPELPTISEFYPGFENSIWLGLFAPASVPEPILKKLREEIRRALESADLKERFNHAGGLEPLVLPPDEFAALIRRDYGKYAKVVKDLGVKVD